MESYGFCKSQDYVPSHNCFYSLYHSTEVILENEQCWVEKKEEEKNAWCNRRNTLIYI